MNNQVEPHKSSVGDMQANMMALLCFLTSSVLVFAMLLTLAGCGGEQQTSPAKNTPSESQTSPASGPADELPSILFNTSWPKNSVPAELPEYTDGEVTAWVEDADGLTIKINNTDESELNTYLDSLKDAGWIVTLGSIEDEAVLGRYTVTFDLQGGGTYLQIDVYTSDDAGVWPAGEIPPDVIPPLTGTLVEKIDIWEQTQGIWYFNYTYDGIDEAAAGEYISMLLDSGWSGDDYMVTRTFEWNGKTYGASIEVYETLETRTTFTCNFWLEG